MRFKRGQTATEYLIILAVVIVIALIVVGVLGGIPSIGGGAKSNTVSSYWRTSQIGVVSMSVAAATDSSTADANGSISLRNNKAGTITITGITLTDVSSGTADSNTTDVVLAAGQQGTLTFTNLSNSGTSGETFTYTVSINYTDSATGAAYIFDGDGTKLEGTIAQSLS